MPRLERLIADAVVERQARARLPAILHVRADELAARIEELPGRLVHLIESAEQEVGHGVAVGGVGGGGEVELSRLLEEVVDVDLRDLAVESGVDVVFSHQEVEVV